MPAIVPMGCVVVGGKQPESSPASANIIGSIILFMSGPPFPMGRSITGFGRKRRTFLVWTGAASLLIFGAGLDSGFEMNARKQRRSAFAVALVLAGGIGALLVVSALKDNVLYFYSPSDVIKKHVQPGVPFRIGGLVRKQSLKHGEGAEVTFVVTDGRDETVVQYQGVLPALFREGQGVVAMGALTPAGVFSASEVLAKHDERYMPPEVVDALKRAGRWKEGPK